MVLKSSQKYFYSLPSLLGGKVLAGGVHKSDFETLECPGSYYTPAQEHAFCITPDVFPQASRSNAHHPTTPQRQHQSTHQQSLLALTTSSPLQQIRPGLGGSSYVTLFSGKNTLAAIFFLTGCVYISDFQKHTVACCNISWQWRPFFFLLPSQKKKKGFLFIKSEWDWSEVKHKGGGLSRSTRSFS